MKKYITLGSVMAFMPLLTFATYSTTTGLGGILNTIGKLINAAVPIAITLAVLFFIISLLMFLLREGEEKAKAKTQMIWGIVILFAIVAMWGLVAILGDTFGVSNQNIDLKQLTPTLAS